jgi:hypothetical protein
MPWGVAARNENGDGTEGPSRPVAASLGLEVSRKATVVADYGTRAAEAGAEKGDEPGSLGAGLAVALRSLEGTAEANRLASAPSPAIGALARRNAQIPRPAGVTMSSRASAKYLHWIYLDISMRF